MTYQLRPGLSFGFIGERAVLLDLDINRYFLIKAEAAQALRDLMVGAIDAGTYHRLPRPGGRPLLVEGDNGIDPVEAALPGCTLFDAPRHARNLEAALRAMRDRHRAGGAPEAFAVTERHEV